MTTGDGKAGYGWNLDSSYTTLPDTFYARMELAPVRSPQLIILNEDLASSLGIEADYLRSRTGVDVLAGNSLPPGATPLAQAYAGHQFGHFTMLGDGRALLLGEQMTPRGERYDIQLKGSGRTPYSRRGDGRAAVGPMLREYMISEGMHGLGIPTTRSLAVVGTGETIIREEFLPGAVLTRVAASHLRVGTFQYAAAWGELRDLRALADYALERHYPEPRGENPYLFLLRSVIRRQADLIAKWQLIGFVHGVMNTDNMTISGETIDYGPCAFLDAYDPATVFSSIDSQGRYAFGNQPPIAAWNLTRFAETLLPLLHSEEEKAVTLAQDAIAEFPPLYHDAWLNGMRFKLGLSGAETDDESLASRLLTLMKKYGADYTDTFRALTFAALPDNALFASPAFTVWQGDWQQRLSRQPEGRDAVQELMKSCNPAVIPRNHMVEAALAKAVQGDYSVMERLLIALAQPYAHTPEQEEYAAPPQPSSRPYRTFCGT